MTVVRKASSTKTITKKKESKVKVDSVVIPNELQELQDTSFGSLDASKDGLLVAYDAPTDKFILITADDLLITSAEDGDIPDEFVTQLESELNINNIGTPNLDGGTW